MNRLTLNKDKTGENIRLLIHQSGLTYDAIAEHLMLSSSRVIYDWMNGFKMPKLEHLYVLSRLLDVAIEDILVI